MTDAKYNMQLNAEWTHYWSVS